MASVTVIIVTFNSASTIGHCVDSILHSTTKEGSVEVVVVDNNSSDHTVQILDQYYPGCKVIVNNRNLGFGSACNQGAQLATTSHLLFLNPDIVIDSSAIEIMLSDIRSQTSVLGGKLYDGRYGYLKESARKLPTLKSSLARITGIDHIAESWSYYIDNQGDDPLQVDALTGAFFLVSSEIFRELGEFDEDYFLYGEDLDLFKRFKDRKIPVYIIPHAKAVHFKGESGFKSWKRNYHFYNALVIYAKKHFGLSWPLRILLSLLTALLAMFKTISQRLLTRLLYVLMFVCLYLGVSALWSFFYHKSLSYFNWETVTITSIVLSVTSVVMLSLFGYFIHRSNTSQSKGVAPSIAVVVVMVLYAFLPESMRFSRLSVLLATMLSGLVSIWLLRSRQKDMQVFRSLSSIDFQESISHVFPSATFTQGDNYDSIVLKTSPFSIADLEQQVKNDTQVCYYNEMTKSLFNSDLSYRRGRTYEYFSQFNYNSIFAKRQRGLLNLFMCMILSVLLLPKILFSKSRAVIRRNLKNLITGELSLIGDYLPKELVVDRPYIGLGLLSIDRCNPTHNAKTFSYNYTLHYSILEDMFYCSSNFVDILKKIQDDIKD